MFVIGLSGGLLNESMKTIDNADWSSKTFPPIFATLASKDSKLSQMRKNLDALKRKLPKECEFTIKQYSKSPEAVISSQVRRRAGKSLSRLIDITHRL